MKKLFVLVMAILTSCGVHEDAVRLYIGTYTRESSEGIYTYCFDQNAGKWTLETLTRAANPSFLLPGPDGHTLFASNQNKTPEDGVERFSYDPETGALVHLDFVNTAQIGPCYVATNGSIVLAANYAGGSLDVFPLAADGSLQPCSQSFPGTACGPHPNQAASHVHCAVFTPDGKYALVTDFSADRLITFRIDGQRLEMIDDPYTPVRPGTGPRHIIFNAAGDRVYVIGELSGEVTVFVYADGRLETLQVIRCDDVDAQGSADIHFSPDEKFFYASNRLKNDGIAIFSVDADGLLTRVGYANTGLHPRHFALSPNGRYLLCACMDSNIVQVFERDAKTGLLSDTHNDIPASLPAFVLFP
ncbi:MAG: lactonase family protein [Bacteroidales bacterium]|nr:lactonase family protein [Bacteroidales bacterium]